MDKTTISEQTGATQIFSSNKVLEEFAGENERGRKIIVANWKMNLPPMEEWADFPRFKSRVVICPPFSHLEAAKEHILNIDLGAQDSFWEEKGAFTGEVSPELLSEIGVKYAIIGHSERRIKLGESDDIINKKLKATLESGIIPILCVGETKDAKDFGKEEDFVREQIKKDLNGISSEYFNRLVIAYEPVWAISTQSGGEADTPEHALKMIRFIKGLNSSFIYSRFIYGGSVNPENASGYLNNSDIEGALVGSASLDVEKFKKIIEIADGN